MSIHRTKLKLLTTGEQIDAELHDALSLDDLLDSQALWAPGKIGIAKEFLRRGIDRRLWPQSLHWNWADKASALKPYAPGPLSVFRLFGMKAQDKWQGTLLACCAGHHARTGSPGRDLVYIDFVETAPWNWDLPAIEQRPLLRGIGIQLFEMAVRWSEDLGFRGRIGLHSLPQADAFYRDTCGMEDLGPDLKERSQLRYFELTEAQARVFLMKDES